MVGSTVTIGTGTVLDGVGHQVALSGGNAVRVFEVSPNVEFTLANLTIANGASTAGAGLFNAGGTVKATNCVFTGNLALGRSGSGFGNPGTVASGGAVYNAGDFYASRCAFVLNRAEGGRGADGNPVATQPPPPAGIGAPGNGGALYNLGTMYLEGSLLASNSAAGGAGGKGSAGDYYYITYPYPFATPGGKGGAGAGGALHNGNAATAAVVNCTFAWNQGTGGSGGTGGTMSGPVPYINFGVQGGNGGDGVGAIFGAQGLLSLTNCTVAGNAGNGGAGGPGGACNFQGPGGSGGGGVGGYNLELSGSGALVNCLFATNTGLGAWGGYGSLNGDRYHPVYGYGPTGYFNGNLRGNLADKGHNLSSDVSASLTNATSLLNVEPRLGPLANNGGPTLAMALLPGSPAIDGADAAAAPSTDQRGCARPLGAAPDIGAYEYGFPIAMKADIGSGGQVEIRVFAAPGQTCWLLSSPDLSSWRPIATNQASANGIALFLDAAGASGSRFYRAALP